MMIDVYIKHKMKNDAIRLAKKYTPERVNQINQDINESSNMQDSSSSKLQTAKL